MSAFVQGSSCQSKALSTQAGMLVGQTTVPITGFNTQGGRGSGGHKRLREEPERYDYLATLFH